MKKIDKLIATARRGVLQDEEHRRFRELRELDEALERMTIEQLCELVYGDPSEERLKEILESVGGLHLLESG